MTWFSEELYKDFYKQSLKIDKLLISKQTRFQDMKIFENKFFGKVLTLDGVVQTTEKDEFFYHEMFVHVPAITFFAASNSMPKRVLIIGGGDGGMLREVLKYSSIEQAIMIDLDEEVVKACAEHMPALNNGAFKDKRADVRFIDGIKYIKEAVGKETFDLILVDSTDPIGVADPLFTPEFYNNCKQCLSKHGILATQSGVPFFQQSEANGTHNNLANIFDIATFFTIPVPTYVGSYMVLSFASNSVNPKQFELTYYKEKFDITKIKGLKYYNPDVHFASFMLPNYIKQQ